MKSAKGRHARRDAGRRDRILRSAVGLFHERGIASTNVGAIATIAGIRPATLYHHFPDKQGIVDACVDLANESLGASIERAREEGPAGPSLETLIDTLVDWVTDDVALATVGRHDRTLASPPVRRRAERRDRWLVDVLVSAIGEARPDRTDGERRALAHGVVGVIWSVTHSDLHLGKEALRSHLRAAARAVVLGRISRGGRRARRGRAAV